MINIKKKKRGLIFPSSTTTKPNYVGIVSPHDLKYSSPSVSAWCSATLSQGKIFKSSIISSGFKSFASFSNASIAAFPASNILSRYMVFWPFFENLDLRFEIWDNLLKMWKRDLFNCDFTVFHIIILPYYMILLRSILSISLSTFCFFWDRDWIFIGSVHELMISLHKLLDSFIRTSSWSRFCFFFSDEGSFDFARCLV